MIRPIEHFVHKDPVAIVPGWACYQLGELCLDELRTRIRGDDTQLDAVLQAIRLVGIEWRNSYDGTSRAPQPEPVRSSGQTVSTTTAASILGVTDRAVRRMITERRLPATLVDKRWRVDREELEKLRANRAAA